MQKKHFFLGNQFAEVRSFTPRTKGGSQANLPERNRQEHAAYIKEKYNTVFDQAINALSQRSKQGLPVADGVYLNFDMVSDFVPSELAKSSGASIVKISEDKGDGNVDVTIYVKKEKNNWLNEKVDDYANEEISTSKGRPKHAKLIEPINSIEQADIHSLYTSAEEFDKLPNNHAQLFEVWVTKDSDYKEKKLTDTLDTLGLVSAGKNILEFDGVVVLLIKATKQQLSELPYSLGNIEGVRPYKQPSVLIHSHKTSRDWGELIKEGIKVSSDSNDLKVGLLDTGVNNAHELIAPILPDHLMRSVIGTKDCIDHSDHGTGMAGLILYGDFTDLIYSHNQTIDVENGLVSVKIVEDNYESDSDFYGAIIEDAMSQAHEMGASIQCMAVTDSISYDGQSTSSSAALDESIYNCGNCDRMVVVSAGNIETTEIDATQYIESCKANAIKSPAQAWNALTVGAFTEKTITNDVKYKALAAPGGISPFSRSSWCWRNGLNKPEIVMEGGNVANHSIYQTILHHDLSLISTSAELAEYFEPFYATSAATALAARLAAKIKKENPDLSMLSVRGMMVHSAGWTQEMERIGNGSINDIMSICGYGVPNEDMALFSSEKYATYIFENELIPYANEPGKSNNKYNEMHFYDLPWPTDLLEEMGSEKVKIRITLSYYVKPSPGYVGRKNKYRYPSATLHFDLKSPNENVEEFLCRRNKNEGDKTTDNETQRWTIKQTRREQGTVQSDWFECTAAELAACGQIVVYPGAGWWKERKLRNVDNLIKYSLIVSITTDETEIYNAVKAKISNKITIPI